MADDRHLAGSGAAAAADQRFLAFFDGLFTDEARVSRPTRSGGAGTGPDGFDPAAYAQAELLEVHFADGSVFYTDPQDFADRHALTDAARSGGQADAPVRLPFTLGTGAAAATTRGSGNPDVPVDHYRIARLTDKTALDRLYDWGAKFAGVVDRWFGGSSDPNFATRLLAARLCRAYENAHLDPAIGDDDGVLLRWQDGRWQRALGLPLPEPLTEVLVLLHGTASSTPGSFKGLWQGNDAGVVAPDWRALAAEPTRLVLAFEHRTLTVSPLRNVLDLLRQLGALGLPAGVRVQWVSHSRGGMVGDLLALALGTADEVNARAASLRPVFEQAYPADHPERPEQAELFGLLQSRSWPPGWVAGTFVRVASPARGTLLADRRTDFFLSLLLRSVALAFGGNGNPWFERLQRLVRALVAARADAKNIPGLEAMIPGRPLSLALNTPPEGALSLPGKLRVIAGDSEGRGIGGLLSMVGDVFYGLHDHDFVVHTHSMFGGFPRGNALSRRVAGQSVTHFGYFKADSPTRDSVFRALGGDDTGFESMAVDEARTRGLWQALVFEYSRWTQRQWLDAMAAPGAGDKPIVVVLPGIMGSELAYVGQGVDHPVWMAPASIANGALADLSLASTRALQASGLVPMAYERVLAQARRDFHVVALPYDWRRSIPDAAGQLIDLLRRLLPHAERMDVPVHLLAHSMGGLVSRLALWCNDFGLADRRGDLTAKLEARGLRLVQCGTPNRGSYAPLLLLMQQHPLTRQLASVARGVSPRDLAVFGARYPGLIAMMPDEKDPTFDDLFDPDSWTRIVAADPDVVPPDPPVLAEAAQVRRWLAGSLAALRANPRVFYVAGHALTPLGLKLLGGSPGSPERPRRPPVLRLGVSMEGDGTVPWNATLAPERTWYTDCAHGSLLDHTDAFAGYFELLLQGRTHKLSLQRPTSRGADDPALPRGWETPAPPSLAADPTAYLLGLDPRAGAPRRLAPIRLRVVHASLDYARYPLLVGHYLDDGVFGAVKRVDTKLHGQFSRTLRFGLFVGAGGTSTYLRVASADGRAPAYPGAIVLGLGQVGDLTPASLVDTVARGVLDFAFEHLHQDAWARGDGPLELRLSTVLVGTNVRSLSVRDSLAGLLQGAWRASQVLAEDGTLPRPARIAEIEVVELHEAIALDAAYALDELLERRDWQQRFVWPQPVLQTREGGVHGYRPGQDDCVWQRLLVHCDPVGALKFELIAERARVESTQNRADVFSLRSVVARACDAGAAGGGGAVDAAEFGRILFNLLLPQPLKGRLSNFNQTVLLVDDASAALPWELLTPPAGSPTTHDEAAQPLAVQAGMVRQRRVTEYREATRRNRPTTGGHWGVLVVGAPDTTGWLDAQGQPLRPFAALPGAADEARLVAGRFASDARPWRVTAQLPDPVASPAGAAFHEVFTQVLRPEPWRVLHLAGHGMVDLWQRSVSDDGVQREVRGTGMVLSDQQMLTAGLVEQMDPPPDFVFINCCYSGDTLTGLPSDRARRDLPALAANLALAFIRMGSRAVVASGWQVNDADGKRFAATLYEQLLRGETFGQAVLVARQVAYDGGASRSNTWGAYQCYGDPAWRLSDSEPAAARVDDGAGIRNDLRAAARCKSPRELADRIAQVAAVAGDSPRTGLGAALGELVDAVAADPVRQPWLQDTAVLARLGEAWHELGEGKRALDAFFDAARQAHSALSLNHAEYAANLVSRLGGDRATESSLALLDRLDALEDALSRDAVIPKDAAIRHRSLARAERDCLRGSAMARQADDTTLAADMRGRLMLRAASHYGRAHQDRCALAAPANDRAYALSNAAMLAGLAAQLHPDLGPEVAAAGWLDALVEDLGRSDGPPPPDTPAGLGPVFDAIGGLLAELDGQGNDFWSFAGLLDLRLGRQMLSLSAGPASGLDSDADLAALAELAEVALLRWPSPTQLDSLSRRPRQVLEALKVQRQGGQAPAPRLAALLAAVQRLVDRLDAAANRHDEG